MMPGSWTGRGVGRRSNGPNGSLTGSPATRSGAVSLPQCFLGPLFIFSLGSPRWIRLGWNDEQQQVLPCRAAAPLPVSPLKKQLTLSCPVLLTSELLGSGKKKKSD